MERLIFHIDVNNAFLSWTAVDMLKNGSDLDIRTIPSIIGGDEESRHGIVLAKSNIAKQFGITTGEPIFFARKKCPQIKIFKMSREAYRKYSDALYNLFLEYTNKVERFSIDECFLDMTGMIMKNETALKKAKEISTRIKEEFGFTVNIGIAPNKLLAKTASDFTKPDRIHTLYKEEIPIKMWILPVSELLMVGRKSLPKLEKMGIKTIGDLAHFDEIRIINAFGKFGKMIWEFANGIDNSEVNYQSEKPKGIGNSVTLSSDCHDIEKLEKVLLALTDEVTYRLRKECMLASVVTVELKNKDFKVTTHQNKLSEATSSTKIVFKEVKKLMNEMYHGEDIRLLGVRVDKLTDTQSEQISLFEENKDCKQEKLDNAIDKLKDKYGYTFIKRATEVENKKNKNQK